ncbi:NAD-dependent epimerase/dehydratase family protein [Aestuariispira insulae]|uniref:CDP-paratose 2-epimerase n=1 Tax=Aestuariispira insulae TaxID=1461337 RepID=A0A3D9H3X0_9PROT|nr:NAD-dependent epimerase/dehydratase family protein [Aestuariispira insulae]RED44189.1 CDP-paratose 2-epimerase [Aestuariispira insulae]
MGRRILITGGAGFVGSNLSLHLKAENPGNEVIALDNLKRRGSELNLSRLAAGGVVFQHGDVRTTEDLAAVGAVDLLIECSAEPSVHAGQDGSLGYLINSNLIGAINCFDHARAHGSDVIFLSSSRVYPIPVLRDLPLVHEGGRLDIPAGHAGTGWSCAGISTDCPLLGHRSLYGATKLSAELLLEEYRQSFGLRTIINRFGVLAGPWQMGKVDQGFIALWAARHLFGGELKYLGFGGYGHQVRDVLHVADMCRLISFQIQQMDKLSGGIFNAGGGADNSISLAELTEECRKLAGREMSIQPVAETAAVDIPWYITDNSAVTGATGWTPKIGIKSLLEDVFGWLDANRALLQPIFSPEGAGTTSKERQKPQ